MTRYSKLFAAIQSLESKHKQPDLIASPINFPFPTIYQSQMDVINSVPTNSSFCLTSHTGWGKTPVFMSMIRNTSALVIEPRKFLQNQVAKYYNDMVVFGRSGYHCPHAPPNFSGSKTAAMAPCLAKADCDGTTYHDTCKNANNTCLNKPCDIFEVNGEWHQYPCDRCEYNDALRKARGVLTSGGCIVANFGNFWPFVKSANVIVVDEAGLFFKEISKPMKLKYTKPNDVI